MDDAFMKPRGWTKTGMALATFLVTWLTGCLGGANDTPTTITPDPRNSTPDTIDPHPKTLAFYREDGTPAFGARVTFYPFDYLPGVDNSGSFSTQTDAAGRYAIDTLVRGLYNVFAYRDEPGGTVAAFLDSVQVSAGGKTVRADTLRAVGGVVGWIHLQPQQDAKKVFVALKGSGRQFQPDPQGKITFGELPAGKYKFIISTSESDYLPAQGSFAVRSGKQDSLADTVMPVFKGVPVATGLKIKYDTAAGVAHLSWHKVVSGRLKGYKVYRDATKGFVIDTPTPIGMTSDTEFTDTLIPIDKTTGRIQGFGTADDSVSYGFQYSIAVVDTAGSSGIPWGRLDFEAPSPFFIRTDFSFYVSNLTSGKSVDGNVVSLGDSVRIDASFENPTRRLTKVQWFSQDTSEAPFHESVFEEPMKKGKVAALHKTLTAAGTEPILFRAWDDAGASWLGRVELNVSTDTPHAAAGNDTVVSGSVPVNLRGGGSDGIGRIVKWEWDIGATGKFVETSGPDTTITSSNAFGDQACILRVTDDDGQQALDTMIVRTGFTVEQVPQSPDDNFDGWFIGQQSLVFGGKLWLLGGLTRYPGDSHFLPLNRSSADGKKWEAMDSSHVFPSRAGHGAVVFKDKMWVLGGRILVPVNPSDPAAQWTYHRGTGSDVWSSSDGKSWNLETANGFPALDGFSVVVFKDRIWVLGGMDRNRDPSDGSWYSDDGVTWTQTLSTSPLPPLAGHASVSFNGKIYVIGGFDLVQKAHRKEVWSSDDGINWTRIQAAAPFGNISGHQAVVFKNRIWVIGGAQEAYHFPENAGAADNFFLYNKKIWYSEDGNGWTGTATVDDVQRVNFSTGVFDGRLWILFGFTLFNVGFAQTVFNVR